jgi:hypothetical protein
MNFITASSGGGVRYPHEYRTDDATRSPKVHNALNKIGSCMTAVGRTYFEFPVLASAWHGAIQVETQECSASS